MYRTKTFLWIFLWFFNIPSSPAQEIHPSVFHANRGEEKKWVAYQDNHRALYTLILNKAMSQLEAREKKVAEIKTKAEWAAYQKQTREILCGSLKKFSKTPLKPKVTGTIERSTFTVEKILFESHPQFFVTGCLFLPKERQNPAPAVIYCSGHTELGFRSDTYQQVILNLVNKGFIVFAFDPIGQGERFQYPDPATGKSKVGGATTEHSYAGAQTLLTGSSLSDYFIWDGIRAVDYLETRPEVDIERIGITGRSGGGTQSALIGACDQRIYASAPECYITSFQRLLQSIGPQDAEQNPYRAIEQGFNHPDFLHARAPNPTLIVTTTHDFFSIQGARETFSEAKRSFDAFGKPENVEFTEDNGIHESTKNNRETVYAFFQKHLNLPGNKTDEMVTLFSPDELHVTPTGQVGTSFPGETVFSLNKKYFSPLEVPQNELKAFIKNIAGIHFNRKLTSSVYTGRFSASGQEIKKYFLENDQEDFALPVFIVQKKEISPTKTLVWIHPGGKEKILEEAMLPAFLEEGYKVISCDLPGTGELHDPGFSGDGFVRGVPFNYTFGANLIGKSVPGIQAEAIDIFMQFVNPQHNPTPPGVDVLVQENATSPLLHFAALSNPFRKIIVFNPPEAFKKLIEEEYYDPWSAFYVAPGSLPFYDQERLISLLPEKNVRIFQSRESESPSRDSAKEILRFLEIH